MKLAHTYISLDDYLKSEENQKVRHEYLDGQIFAMSVSSKEHNRIAGNLYARLIRHLRGSSYQTFIYNMKVKIEMANPTADLFYYPDLMVTCELQDHEKSYQTSPCLILEVFSPSTAILEQREKRLNYQSLPSLQEYVLVSQEEVIVEVYSKNATGKWFKEILESQDFLLLKSVNLTLTMVDIYEDVLLFPHSF